MKTLSTYSPVSLRYIAALRGNIPQKIGQEFTYAEASCREPEKLICLAASNPDGRFYGFVADDTERRNAEDMATQREIFNVVFLTGSPKDILERLEGGSSLPPMLDYLCCNEDAESLPVEIRAALFDLAKTRMNPGGLFVFTYPILNRKDDALRLLVQGATDGLDNDEEKLAFLNELKALGTTFFAENPSALATLDNAVAKKSPQLFFDSFNDAVATLGTIDTLISMGSRGFTYAGDTTLSTNFVDLALPCQAHEAILARQGHALYEAFKDFALNRSVRSDLWIKEPADRSDNMGTLFGGFAYGLLVPRQNVPNEYTGIGKAFDLSQPLFQNILELMTLMPVGVGDIMNRYPDLASEPQKIMAAIQILVACGYVAPMRGIRTPLRTEGVAQPHFVGSFNRFVDKINLSDQDVLFASAVAGCGMILPARDAFVMQALNRAGLTDSVAALLPELGRIAGTPAGKAVIQADEPTPESAHAMVLDVVEKSLPQWYAYALLEAS